MRSIVLMCLLFVIGCGTKVELVKGPVEVSGKLTNKGAPVGDVVLTLQPAEAGFMTNLNVGADGTFKGEVVPGKYMYFVGKSTSKSSDAALKKIDSKYYEASLTRFVQIDSGKSIDVALD